MKLPFWPVTPPPRKRKRERCAGCGGWTDGRHLDRELLKDAVTDDESKGPHAD